MTTPRRVAAPWSTGLDGPSPTLNPPGTWLLPGPFALIRPAGHGTPASSSGPVPSPPDAPSPAARRARRSADNARAEVNDEPEPVHLRPRCPPADRQLVGRQQALLLGC